MKTKLKPCPFCGFTPNPEEPDCIYPINREKSVHSVNCYESGGGCGASVTGWTMAEAIDNWNRRVDTSEDPKTYMHRRVYGNNTIPN